MKNLLVLTCLGLVALSVSLLVLPEEEETFRDHARQLNRLADSGGLEKMRILLGDDFDRLLGDLEPLLGGDDDPDHFRPILGGDDDPEYSRPILGGDDDPEYSRPILGGDDDPEYSRPILGGDDDPEYSRPILGGDDDPEYSRPILGGDDDPEYSRPILGGDDDPEYSRPILGGDDDPEYSRPILGGDDDPEHVRPILGGDDDPDHESIFGGQSDPEQDIQIAADPERNGMVYPEKFERVAPKSGSIKPIRGKSPAKQNNNKGSQPDIPVDVDPCLPSDLPDPTPKEELCETAECPVYEVVEVEGTCGFELRKYTSGVWVMTEMNMKKGIAEAYTEAAEQLMEYMNGGNDGNVTMEATKPKTVVYIMDKNTPRNAYLSQFLPISYHEDPPQPSEGKPLIVKHNPEMQYYVRAFGGKPSIHQYRREFAMLAAAVKKSGLNAVRTMQFYHEYSNPGDEAQRHEVAVMVAPSQS